MTSLEQIEQGWNEAARADAMFYILTTAGKENGGWDPVEFFSHGKREIDEVISWLDNQDFRGRHHRRALDFGCGIGRLTQSLADYYGHVDGVDVSAEMIRQAQAHIGRKARRCSFYVNQRPDLKLFDDRTYDLIYTVIVLQHMPNSLQKGYIQEFIRLIVDDGVAVFQLPDGGELIQQQTWLSMYGARPSTVTGWVEEAGGEMLKVEPSPHAGDGWPGWLYVARRRP